MWTTVGLMRTATANATHAAQLEMDCVAAFDGAKSIPDSVAAPLFAEMAASAHTQRAGWLALLEKLGAQPVQKSPTAAANRFKVALARRLGRRVLAAVLYNNGAARVQAYKRLAEQGRWPELQALAQKYLPGVEAHHQGVRALLRGPSADRVNRL